MEALPPGINLQQKILFSHVHKAAGSSFLNFLLNSDHVQPALRPCTHLQHSGGVYPSSSAALIDWWYAALPRENCTLLAMEMPQLGEALRLVEGDPRAIAHAAKERQSAGIALEAEDEAMLRAAASALANASSGGSSGSVLGAVDVLRANRPNSHEPQVITLYRDPLSRCRSSWSYEQRLCHGLVVSWRGAPVISFDESSRAYCHNFFLPRFGEYSNASVQQAFAQNFCGEHHSVSSDLEERGLSFRGLIDSRRLRYIGLADESVYATSVCLFLFQAARFPRHACSCDAAKKLSLVELHDQNRRGGRSDASASHAASVAIPELALTAAELEEIAPREAALYREASREFRRRVRAAEAYLDARFGNCPSQARGLGE